MQRYHVYGVGAALVDTEIEVSDTFLEQAKIEKGLMTLVDEARQDELILLMRDHLVGSKRASGGSACNSIIAASYFGAKTFYSCKVADDENGIFFQHDTKAAGVDTIDDAHPNGTTGKCLVMITPDAERTMNTFLGVSAELDESQLDHNAIANSEYLYIEGYLVTSPSGKQAAIAARKIAEENKVKTSISLSDPGMVQFFADGLQEMIGEKVDLIFCNKDEALGWTKADNIEQAAQEMKKSANTFAITLGKDGALVFDGSTLTHIEGSAAKAIDTNGAGDMFAGAFLYAITHGQSFPEAAKMANLAAAQVVSQYGPRLQPEQHAHIKTNAS
jgi:sugar/nucleoside kinase (ribokinase family)